MEQLEELQSRLAFQEDAIAELNKVVAEQAKELSFQQAQFKILYRRVNEVLEGFDGRGESDDVPPPHY